MFKELSEDFNSIKTIQSETKDTLIEIKNNLQGNNNAVDETKIQINDTEHKEAKTNKQKTPSNQNNKKKGSPPPKKMKIV